MGGVLGSLCNQGSTGDALTKIAPSGGENKDNGQINEKSDISPKHADVTTKLAQSPSPVSNIAKKTVETTPGGNHAKEPANNKAKRQMTVNDFEWKKVHPYFIS